MGLPSYPEIDRLIESGQVLPYLQEFIRFSATLSVGVRTGQMANAPGMEATVVAGVVLDKLMNTTDGRRLLGIRATNAVFNAKDEPVNSPKLDIARRMILGEISQPQALIELKNLLSDADIHPDPKTLKKLLRDLEDEAQSLMGQLDYLMRVAGWDGVSTGDLLDTAKSIITGRPKHENY